MSGECLVKMERALNLYNKKCLEREDIQMAKKHMKRYSMSLIFREMQNKTINTMRYHLTPVRIDFIKRCTNNKCWKVYREKGTLLPCWWKCELTLPLWRTEWRFFKKINK